MNFRLNEQGNHIKLLREEFDQKGIKISEKMDISKSDFFIIFIIC